MPMPWTDFINDTARNKLNGQPEENAYQLFARLKQKANFVRLFDYIKDEDVLKEFFHPSVSAFCNAKKQTNDNDLSTLLESCENICQQFRQALLKENLLNTLNVPKDQQKQFLKALEGCFLFKICSQAFKSETQALEQKRDQIPKEKEKEKLKINAQIKEISTHYQKIKESVMAEYDHALYSPSLKTFASRSTRQSISLFKKAQPKSNQDNNNKSDFTISEHRRK